MDTSVLPTLGETIRYALHLDAAIYAAIQQNPAGIWVALSVVCLAALSEAVGQSIILFLNRVRPWRFGFALLMAALRSLVGYGLWTASVWLVGSYVFGRAVPGPTVASAVGLAYAPQLLSFFTLIPFLGPGLATILSLWSMLAIVVAVRVGLGLETWQAIVTSGLGWLLIGIWQRTLGRPIYVLGRWIEQRVAGVPLEFTWQNVPLLRQGTRWIENWEAWRRRQSRIQVQSRALQHPRGDRSHV
jgi:hypothetical protein